MSEAMKHVVIVGASRGLGRGAVEEHLKRGWHVTATARQPDALSDLSSDRLSVVMLDATDWAAIDALRDTLPRPIDRLFVVAGATGANVPIGDAEPSEFADVMWVNAMAPLRIVERWSERLAPDALVAVMSSSLGSIALNETAGFEVYRMSKVALNMGLRSIAVRRDDARTYVAINPGWVRTALGGPHAHMSVEESIPQVVDVLDRHATDRGIHFLDVSGETLPW